MSFPRLLTFLAALCAAVSAAQAAVTCAPIFTDHMVLQREMPIAVWGKADPGEAVTVRFGADEKSTKASADGSWSVRLDPKPTNAGGIDLVVAGTNTLTFTDVLVGEVWLCSGQSNMEKPIGVRSGQQPCDDAKAEIAAANYPYVRLFQVPRNGKPAEGDSTLRWLPCSPGTVDATHFSAAGYYFAREIFRELNVPIGMIHTSVGGTRIEAWIAPEMYAEIPELADIAALVKANPNATIEKTRIAGLYNSMVRPYAPYTLRGFLWYQGESNLMPLDIDAYPAKMRALVEGWRRVWQREDAPFLHVQLAPHTYSKRKQPKPLSPFALPLFWEAQNRSLEIPGTGQAVIVDTTTKFSDIHPTNKRDVGVRLAKIALNQTYGKTEVVASGPTYNARSVRGSTVAIALTSAVGLRTKDGGEPTGFEIAGEDRAFVPAKAEIRQQGVFVSSPQVPKPVAVRYGWHETKPGNLANGAGLPARPFRTDNWPVDPTRPVTPDDVAPPKPAAPAAPAAPPATTAAAAAAPTR